MSLNPDISQRALDGDYDNISNNTNSYKVHVVSVKTRTENEVSE